jgi:hypothetical protein
LHEEEDIQFKTTCFHCYENFSRALMDPDDATALQQLQQDSSNQGQEDGIIVLGCACKYHG